MLTDLASYELEERINDLLPSQRAFVFDPAPFSCIASGFGSGKTHAACLKGVILSQHIPGNRGLIGRYRNTDLEDTTKPVFFDVCPPSWIKSYNKKHNIVVLRNGSSIVFRHIHDASSGSATKTRRLGANLGWFMIDQMEELEEVHWNAMISRLRFPGAPKKFGFGTINPNGHDWNWKKFFPLAQEFGPDGKLNGKFTQIIRPNKLTLGVVTNAEENRKSNGGFLDDDYFDNLLASYPLPWIQRYVRASFQDFSGKLFADYRASLTDPQFASVHNIRTFPIPRHWDLIVGIDVGGESPWAVVPSYVDEWGNLVVMKGFVKPRARVAEVAAWIKANLPWNEGRTTYVIDWENKVAALELAEHGIHAIPATKHVLPGILRTMGYFHVQKGRPLPPWFIETQSQEQIDKFSPHGSPMCFVSDDFEEFRTEHDKVVWDEKKKNQIKKTDTERFDTCDAFRYVVMQRPLDSKKPVIDKYAKLRAADPLSAREWEEFDKRLARKLGGQRGQYMTELYSDAIPEQPRYAGSYEF
jgi:hypothetical protein